MPKKLSKTTTDHDEIRRWVEERGGSPAEVASTERQGQTGILRIDFPGYTGEGSLKEIPWEQWFEKFDASGLAFVYQEVTSTGERSNFNKLIARETAAARDRGERTSRRSSRGQAASRRRAPSASAARTAGRRTKGGGS